MRRGDQYNTRNHPGISAAASVGWLSGYRIQ